MSPRRLPLAPLTAEQAETVAANMGLVRWCASRVQRRWPNEDFDDLVQEGTFGLIRAAQRFEPGRGFQFSTLAISCVERRMYGAIAHRRTPKRWPGYTPASLDRADEETGVTVADVLVAADAPEDEVVDAEWLRGLLAGLPAAYRPIVPALLKEESQKAAAARLGRSQGWVSLMCLRAQRLLREQEARGINA